MPTPTEAVKHLAESAKAFGKFAETIVQVPIPDSHAAEIYEAGRETLRNLKRLADLLSDLHQQAKQARAAAQGEEDGA